MPFVKKDVEGNVLSIHLERAEGTVETPVNDPLLAGFLSRLGHEVIPQDWIRSDLELVRVIEDLIEALLSKDLIALSDLPERARLKLMERSSVRKKTNLKFIDSDDDVF